MSTKNWLFVIGLAALSACGAPSGEAEKLGSSSSSLSLPGLTPSPIDPTTGKRSWIGSPAELMFADAYASCAYNSQLTVQYLPTASLVLNFTPDLFLQKVRSLMLSSVCHYSGSPNYGDTSKSPEINWLAQRDDTRCNVDPSTGAAVSTNLTGITEDISVPPEGPFIGDPYPPTQAYAQRALEEPVTNLCMAEYLRGLAPGAAQGNTLLLSAADQRELLEFTKERAQMAMLEFANLAQVFTTAQAPMPGAIPAFPNYFGLFVPVLQEWAQSATGTRVTQLAAFGNDFATAVQLHATVSQELAELLGRSGSARLPRGGDEHDLPTDIWGPGSWRDRALASIYGGDPLVEDSTHTSPWTHFTNQTTPGQYGEDWPTVDEQPFVDTRVKEPQVDQLLMLARATDSVVLQQTTGYVGHGANLQCYDVDRPLAATRLYRLAEANLRNDECTQFSSTTHSCTTSTLSSIADPATLSDGFAGFELWNKYGITPQHALALVSLLDDKIGKECQRKVGATWVYYNKPGALDFTGNPVWEVASDGVHQYRLGNKGTFRPRTLREIAGLYSRNSHFAMPTTIYPDVDPAFQGFQAVASVDVLFTGDTYHLIYSQPNAAYEQMRTMGSVGALAAVREAVVNAQHNAVQTAPIQGYLARTPSVLSIIEGAIGPYQVSITPVVSEATSAIPLAQSIGSMTSLNRHVLVQQNSSSSSTWAANFIVTSSDPSMGEPNASDYFLYSTGFDPWEASLVEYPDSTEYNGAGVGVISGVDGWDAHEADHTVTFPSNAGGQLVRYHWEQPVPNANTTAMTLFIDGPTLDTGINANGHAVGNISLVTDPSQHAPLDAQYLAFGGTLPQYAARLMRPDDHDQAVPAFDGFGLPTRWVPPMDPQVFGGAPGDDPVVDYLARAKSAAQDATDAVANAFNAYLQQEQDQASLAAAVAKGVQVDTLIEQGLCGSGGTCDTSTASAPFDLAGLWNNAPDRYTLLPGASGANGEAQQEFITRPSFDTLVSSTCVPHPGETLDSLLFRLGASDKLDCLAVETLLMMPTQFQLLNSVAQALSSPAIPSFSQYSGGALQQAAIQQWTSYTLLKADVTSFIAATDAAIGHVSMYQSLVNTAASENEEMDERCSPDELAKYVVNLTCTGALADKSTTLSGDSNVSGSWYAGGLPSPVAPKCTVTSTPTDDPLTWDDEVSTSGGTSNGSSVSGGLSFIAGISFGNSSGTSTSAAPVTLGEKRRLCEQYQDKVDSSTWQLMDAALEAYAQIASQRASLIGAAAEVQSSTATAASLTQQAHIAMTTEALDEQQLAATQTTSFGLYKQLHSYDTWRAQALLNNARVAAVTARRAIEARYVVDLSDLQQPEAFVASPSTWADNIFEYDLDMLPAVGLSVSSPGGDGINPNAVLDYVNNLQQFVQGYAVNRPTAVAQADTDVISLAGPVGLNDATPTTAALGDGRAGSWSYYCAGTQNAWVPLPPSLDPANACTPTTIRPTKAKLVFGLDAWGRPNGDIASPPFNNRFNERWTNFAVNIVGTGVLDCTKAADPNGCYSQSFVSYNLRHVGTPWITDWSESWSVLGVPVGVVESGKALAAEQWLDPINNAWDKPYVQQVSRTEFGARPLGGTYELELELGPQVQLKNIERVQILAGSTYWVSQK